MAELKLENIYKIYDNNVTAVTDFNLHIQDKEFIVFVLLDAENLQHCEWWLDLKTFQKESFQLMVS